MKKKKWAARAVSLMLVVFMAVQLLPLEAVAGSLAAGNGNEKEESPLLYEVAGLRDAYTKVYQREDGTYSAITSAQPVHYLKDGKWEEIDNTLTETQNSEGETVLKNQDNPFDVSLPCELAADEPVSVSVDGKSLSFTMQDTNGQAEAAVTEAADLTGASELQQVSNLDKVNSEVTYNAVQENVDVKYNISNQSVKESILIHEKPSEETGYSYTLEAEGLSAALCKDKSIEFKDENNQVVFTIPAPYMFDGREAYSKAIEVTFKAEGDGTFTLCYTPDFEWMSNGDREYPVTIDPIIRVSGTEQIFDTYVTDETGCDLTTNQNLSTAVVGKTGSVNNAAVFDFDTALYARERVITNAVLKLYAKKTGSGNMPVLAKMKSAVDLTAGYAAINPQAGTAIDYAEVPAQTYSPVSLDITALISKNAMAETANEKYQLCLTANSDIDNSATILTSEFAAAESLLPPVVEYDMVEAVGRRDQFEYHEYSVGRAGNVSINDFTGGMTIEREDIGISGNLMPVSITQRYTTATPYLTGTLETLFKTDYSSDITGANILGPRWLTNYHQFVGFIGGYYIDNAGNPVDLYEYLDGNGNTLYFKKTSEENGTETWTEFCSKTQTDTGLTMTVPSAASGSTNYSGVEIKDAAGQTYCFDGKGRLVQIKDVPNEHASVQACVTVHYAENYDGIKIDYITDGVGRKFQFTYNGSNLLVSIQAFNADGTAITVGNNKLLKVLYTLYDNGMLRQVNFPDGQFVTYVGTASQGIGDYYIATLKNVDRYTLSFLKAGNVNNSVRVGTIQERITAEESIAATDTGKQISITYDGPYQRTYTDTYGGTEIRQFDRYGRTVGVYNQDGEYVSYVYEDVNMAEEGQPAAYKNILNHTYYAESANDNLFSNPGFEDGMTGWSALSSNVAGSAVTANSAYALGGSNSCKIDGAGAGLARVLRTMTGLEAGSYTFSSYLKLPADLTDTQQGANIYVRVTNNDGTYKETRSAYKTTTGGLWQRQNVTFEVTEHTKNVQFFLTANRCNAAVYFDCTKLEKVDYSTGFNLLENGKMEAEGNGAVPTGWTGAGLSPLDGRQETDKFGDTEKVMRIWGGTNTSKSISQTVQVNGTAGDEISIGGWAKALTSAAQNGSGSAFRIRAVYTENGVQKTQTADFIPYVDFWQYTACTIKLESTCTAITVYLDYCNQINRADFTDVKALFCDVDETEEEPGGGTEEPEEPGNCVCGESCVYGEGCDCACASKEACTCLQCKQTQTNSYDAHGNRISTTQTDMANTMSSSQSYTNDGNYIAGETTASGQTVGYNYNQSNGMLASVTDARNNSVQYTYNAMNDLIGVSQAVSGLNGGSSLQNSYSYTKDRLTGISTGNGVQYAMAYDLWGSQTQVKVGAQPLAAYDYGENENRDRVDDITYGNGQKLTYRYDTNSNVTGISYDDGATYVYEYTYDAGALTSIRDNINSQATYYTDEGMQIYTIPYGDAQEELLFSNTYDEEGNFTETTAGVTYAYADLSGDYDEATGKTITERSIQDRTGTSDAYAYGNNLDLSVISETDYFGRKVRSTLTSMTGKDNEISINTQFGYQTLANGNTSEFISSYNNMIAGLGNYSSTLNYTYDYDANGNVTQVLYNSQPYARYYYDEANQLVREDNAGVNKTICYTYDNGGNVTARTEYAYTENDTLGEAMHTVNYAYTDNNWKDKLTGYDGKTLTYDAIGNPLTCGEDITCIWTAGRQLKTYENANFKAEYVYNTDGLRTRQTIYSKETVNGTLQYTMYRVYEYVWKDEVVDSEHIMAFGEDGQKTNEVVMKILYDGDKSPLGFTYTDLVENETQTVWYVKNMQGDITALYMEGKGLVLRISYDAWGKAEYAPGDIEGLEGLKYALIMLLVNPMGYRGYMYDSETSLYYLQSRYYISETGRFLNGDDVNHACIAARTNISAVNMYTFCRNSPVTYVDKSGKQSSANEQQRRIVISLIACLLFGEYYDEIEIRVDDGTNYSKGRIKVKFTNKKFSDLLYSTVREEPLGTGYYLAVLAKFKFYDEFPAVNKAATGRTKAIANREFLFSDHCVGNEIVQHLYGYFWSLNKPGIDLPVAMRLYAWGKEGKKGNWFGKSAIRKRKEEIKKSCVNADICESGVVNNKNEAVVFNYFNGIDIAYRNKRQDPYYINGRRVYGKVRSGWLNEYL